MRYLVIGCSVLRREIESLLPRGCDITCEWFPQGLHAAPDLLRAQLQNIIDRITPADGVEAVLLAFGLCNHALEGVRARSLPLIIPRVSNCIGLLLGGQPRFLEESRRHPATYWLTRGFMDCGGQPDIAGTADSQAPHHDQHADSCRRLFGHDAAKQLLTTWHADWDRDYDHGALIVGADPDAARDRDRARACAERHGWGFGEIPADLSLLRRLLGGEWSADDCVVIQPGQQAFAVDDGRVLQSVSPSDAEKLRSGAVCEESVTYLVDEAGDVQGEDTGDADMGHLREGLGLGIDAGGTYTDAVLYDFAAQRVVASGKGLTTPHDPAIGILEALGHLPRERFADLRLVSLATTFATNAIVEGKGRSVGLILAGYDDWSLARIEHRPCRTVPDHPRGLAEKTPAVRAAVEQAVRELVEKEDVRALGVVAISACFDPAHEMHVAQIVRDVSDLPLVCGHELSSEMNCLLRATTAALNARIAPIVVDLVRSVETMLVKVGIAAPLAIVRANGSLYQAEEACRRPVEMILSGPAASMAGAHALTGLDDAIVVDIGGTTSDVALLRGGRPLPRAEGAVVGKHHTAVRAPAIWTMGLGGDSHIRIAPKHGTISVGPRRVLPISYVAAKYDGIVPRLQELESPSLAELRLLQPAELFVLLREPESIGVHPEGQEIAIIEQLRSGPKTVLDLSRALDYPYLSCLRVDRLEEAGVIIRAGLTPTDLLHARGEFDRWNGDAARRALGLVAGRLGWTPAELDARARAVFRQSLCEILLTAGLQLNGVEGLGDDPVTRRLIQQAFAGAETDGPVHCGVRLSVPIVGIGAAAACFVPGAADLLGTRAVVPERAGVAGAVGAITGSVVEEVRIVIEPTLEGHFILRAPDEARTFPKLDVAKDYARIRATELVRRKAHGSGAGRFHIRLHVEDRQASINPGGVLYIETRVVAQAVGAPRVA